MSEYIEHDKNGISVGWVVKKFYTFAEPPHEMVLENGKELGPVTIAYETSGHWTQTKVMLFLFYTPFPGILTWPVIIMKTILNPAGGISWWAQERALIPTNILSSVQTS